MINQARPPVLLSLNAVRVHFGSLAAVQDVSFELRGGELLGLVGPNGAGKTTLLRAIAGLQPLACGTISVMGHPVLPGHLAYKQQLGFTPDNPAVYPQLRVREFLEFVGRAYGLGADMDSRIGYWLEQVWLSEKANEKISSLSRGMRQCIGVARTMLPNPFVILLDEPAAGLDPAGRVQFRQLLCNLRDEGRTLIVSSHILADLAEYCTHIGIMAAGRMLRFGTVAEVAEVGDPDRCRYNIGLARPVPGLRGLLESIAELSILELDRDRLVVEYGSDRERAAALLAELVRLQVPVASFAAHAPGLEEAYLRTGVRQVD